MDCVFPFFGDIVIDPVGAAWGRMLFSPLEIAVAIIACSIPTLTPFQNRWRGERRQLSSEGVAHGLRRLGLRSGRNGSSTANLGPGDWVGKDTWQNHAFVTLEDGGKFNGDHIEIRKEYMVIHKI